MQSHPYKHRTVTVHSLHTRSHHGHSLLPGFPRESFSPGSCKSHNP
nr:MAG TPA: hypothetical protein [Caudoviricetes sp.]